MKEALWGDEQGDNSLIHRVLHLKIIVYLDFNVPFDTIEVCTYLNNYSEIMQLFYTTVPARVI